MTYIERKIDVRIALDHGTFDGSNDIIEVKGARCQATIQSYSGSTGSFASNMQMRLYGMKPADMAKLSTLGYSSGTYKKNLIQVHAGDDESGMSLVYAGGIFYGDVDYNAMPDVGVDIVASAIMNEQMAKIAASSYKGDMDVATMIRAIAKAAGLKFINAGVTAKLKNHAAPGSAVDQINDICHAAQVHWAKDGDTITIWPSGKTRDDTIIDISAATGMIGYPRYTMQGMEVSTLFNPDIEIGRRATLKTSVPKASPNDQIAFTSGHAVPGGDGTFYIWNVVHDLASQIPNGRWFTTLSLGEYGAVHA